MTRSKRISWKRILVAVVALYAVLWIATMVFGPEAARGLAQRRHLEHQAKIGGNVGTSHLVCTSVSVPAPFIVNAKWTTKGLLPDGRATASVTFDESRTVWFFGWTRVVGERNVGVFCGTPAPKR